MRPMTAARERISRALASSRSSRGLQRSLHESGDRELVRAHAELPAAVLALERTALHEVLERLLEEERVAAGALGEDLGDLLGHLPLGRVADEGPARVRGERPELDLTVAMRVELAGALTEVPGAMLALGPVQEEEAHRRFLGDGKDGLEQLDRRLVGPVEILQDEAERALGCEAAEQLGKSLEGLVLDAFPVQLSNPLGRLRLEREADQAREERVDLLGVVEELGELCLELQAHPRLRGRGSDPEPLTHEIPDRPIGKVLAVGDTATFDETDLGAIEAADLGDEPRLADPGLAHDRDDHAAPVDETVHRPLEHRQLEIAPDERALQHERFRIPDPRHLERRDRGALPGELLLAELLELEAPLHLALRLHTDHDPSARSQGLEPGRDVHGVPERVPRVAPVAVLGRADDHGAGVDPDPGGESDAVGGLDLVRVAGEGALDGQGCENGALRVVLVRHRGAEDGVDLIPAQLRDGAAEAADLLGHDPHHFVDEELRPFRAKLLGDLGRPDEIPDQNRDDPAFSGCDRHGRSYSRMAPSPGPLFQPAFIGAYAGRDSRDIPHFLPTRDVPCARTPSNSPKSSSCKVVLARPHSDCATRRWDTTHCGDMQVQLSEPSLVDDLLPFLRKLQCVVVADAAGTISVTIPDLVPEDARVELGIYLGVWRVMHPDVQIRLLP